MYTSDISKSKIYLIQNIETNEIIVQYRTHQFNSHKAIFSTSASAQKVLNQLNENNEKYRIIEWEDNSNE